MRNHLYIIVALVSFLAIQACNKHEVEEPTFDVTTAKATYKVGEAINFNISGNPDLLVFFSGEAGKKYENIDRVKADGKPILKFVTSAQNGTQVNSLAILVSSDFNGTYSPSGIAAATWTDITSKANLSAGTANVASGDIDLSDFAGAERVFLAFKYTGQQSATSAQRQWTITNFVLNNVLTDGTIFPLFANISAPGWLAIDVKNPAAKWTVSASQLLINGGAVNSADNEDWVVSSGVNLKTITPDFGVSIKDFTSLLPAYTYKYNTAGTYTATFLGSTNNVYGEKEVVKTVSLTITP
ncbi:MAG: DUF5017 domain-containing protein [Bacteroidota bacterium]